MAGSEALIHLAVTFDTGFHIENRHVAAVAVNTVERNVLRFELVRGQKIS